MNEARRGPWYLLTGLLLGFGIGLLIAWVASPVKYTDTAPASLRQDFKARYRALIAEAYVATGDLARAQARLDLLGDSDPIQTLVIQAQRSMAEGTSESEARALGALAAALGLAPTPISQASAFPTPFLSTATTSTSSPTATTTSSITPTPVVKEPSTPTPSPTPIPKTSVTPTATLAATPTGTPTPGSPFILQEMETLCDPAINAPLIQIWVLDASEQEILGIELEITWPGGEDYFFTGLKPEISAGYADYLMNPSESYTLRVASGSEPVTLSPHKCPSNEGTEYWGGYRVVFIQPP